MTLDNILVGNMGFDKDLLIVIKKSLDNNIELCVVFDEELSISRVALSAIMLDWPLLVSVKCLIVICKMSDGFCDS